MAAENRPFQLRLSKIGAFPRLNYPRVIWVGIKEGAEESKKLASEIEKSLKEFGFPEEQRPFSPHLTLGRLRSPKAREKLKETIEY